MQRIQLNLHRVYEYITMPCTYFFYLHMQLWLRNISIDNINTAFQRSIRIFIQIAVTYG